MLARTAQRQKLRVLLAHRQLGTDKAGGRACKALVEEFARRNIEAVTANTG